MDKIKEILIGTNNEGKYREICDLLPNNIKKYSPKEFGILSSLPQLPFQLQGAQLGFEYSFP